LVADVTKKLGSLRVNACMSDTKRAKDMVKLIVKVNCKGISSA